VRDALRICLVSSSLHAVPPRSHGAIESQMMEHARGLARAGHEVHVLTVGEQDGIVSDTLEGIRFHRLAEAYESRHRRRGIAGLARSQVRFGLRARRLCAHLEPDIVHWHSRYPCLLGPSTGATRRARRAPRHVYHVHNWKLAERMPYPRLSPRRAAAILGAGIDRRVAQNCDRVVAISEFIRDRVLATSRVPASRISIVTNVVDVDLFRPDPREANRSGILFVGRIAAEKGVAPLIEGMAAVARHSPQTTLSIVGPDQDGTERGSYMRECKTLVSRLGLERNVRFAGAVPNRELPALLRRSQILAVPSVWGEPLGVVVLEGLACGIPVVASRVGGIPELIEEGRTGLLVPPADPSALGRALLSALHDDALQERASTCGPDSVVRHHTWHAVRERLESIYRLTLEDARPSGSET
jgi:glycosyltransferase involved in cell wall biosynthesis